MTWIGNERNLVTGIVTDIQRFSVHDGPGIRTTVFLKGCNLRCFWCHNPETMKPEIELQSFPARCIGCGACVDACPKGARTRQDGQAIYDRERCEACGACADVCYADALVMAGREMTVQAVVDEVVKDRPFYDDSGGGMTISGGEPLFQPTFTIQALQACRELGIHTAIESNMAWPWMRVKPLIESADLVMMDVKTMDDVRHRKWTASSNAQVLDNARRISAMGKSLVLRTPVVPGANDNADDISAIARFAAELPTLLYYELLPFHPLASGKYDSLGMSYEAAGLQRPPRDHVRTLASIAHQTGIAVRVAG